MRPFGCGKSQTESCKKKEKEKKKKKKAPKNGVSADEASASSTRGVKQNLRASEQHQRCFVMYRVEGTRKIAHLAHHVPSVLFRNPPLCICTSIALCGKPPGNRLFWSSFDFSPADSEFRNNCLNTWERLIRVMDDAVPS